VLTRVWQKWRFSAPQTHLWLIKVWFSASTFVVKIATFAKPETVRCKPLDIVMTKILIIFIFVFVFIKAFGQKVDSIQTKTISVTLLDSLTNQSIPFVTVLTDKKNFATSDQDGNFKIAISNDTSTLINISAFGYEKKTVKVLPEVKQIAVKLKSIPYDADKAFILKSNPVDTIYYKSGKIKTIQYQCYDEISFYENGLVKSKSVNGSYRSWYLNGKLKSQSILFGNHLTTDTEWYDNGQMKEHGTMYWGHNKKTNAGDWFKNNDWKYWDKNGKEKTK
jgi:hypothetical protein